MDDNEKTPMELANAFARCGNFPKDLAGIQLLAQGLRRASDMYDIPMSQIVDACTAASQFCPTDADLINVAREINETAKQARYRAESRRTAGRPSKCPHWLCDGSGWRAVRHLHTHHVGAAGHQWVEKTIVPEGSDVADKIDWKTQMVYDSRYRCRCHPARDPEADPKPRKRKAVTHAA